MILPYQQLSPEALNGIIEDFILREGTDYGAYEASFASKKAELLKQIQQNEVVIVFSELHQTVTLKPATQFK